MIEFKIGNIFEEQAEALVNTVNCVGIMGRGIALQFKKAYPQNYKAYLSACRHHDVQPGKMFVVEISQVTNPRYIINFPTKRHWRGRSRIEDIESGLESLVSEISRLNLRSIALPPLGSGLGSLEWEIVKPRIEAALGALPNIQITVFEPSSAPKPEDIKQSHKIPNMTSGRAALIGLIDRYLQGLMDPVVTLLEIHKLMYFMQVSGEPLRLNYVKAPYGPYAKNLGHVLDHVEGYYISGYADGGDAPDKEIKLVPGAVQEADMVLNNSPDTERRFMKVVALVEGFETPFGMELLSTVHWVAANENANSPAKATSAVYQWDDRKKQFSTRQIELAYNVLQEKGWL